MRRSRCLGLGARAAVLLCWAASCGPADQRVTGGQLKILGSDTISATVQAGADSFVVTYPGASIQTEGGGTVVGIEALLNQEAQVAVLSREPLAAERAIAEQAKVEIYLYPFAHDGLAIVVHPANPVYALSFDELKGVFAGEIEDWGELGGDPGGILVYLSGVQSGALGFVQTEVLDGVPFAKGAGRAPTTRAVVDSVAAHEDAIGFCGMTELGGRVKALPISPRGGGPLKVLSVDTVYRKEYPLVRTFYFGTRGIPRDDLVSGFITFMTSTRGQRIVLDNGFVPATVALHIRYEG